MKYTFCNSWSKAAVLIGIVMLKMFFSVAVMATEIEPIFSNPANGWVLFEDDDGISLGHGGDFFDTEYFFYKFEGDSLSIGLQTQFDVVDGKRGDHDHFRTGDLALSFDGDISGSGGSGYEYAIDFGLQTTDLNPEHNNIDANVFGTTGTDGIDIAGLYENVAWYNEYLEFPETVPFAMNEGDIIANALVGNYAGIGQDSYYRVVSFDTTLVSETQGGDYVVNAHWTMNCGNDGIHGSFYVEGSVESVPEPATVTMLGIGLAGIIAVSIRRRLKRSDNKINATSV